MQFGFKPFRCSRKLVASAPVEFFIQALSQGIGDDEMTILNGSIERHTEAGHSVLHPAADRGFMNGSDAVLHHLSGGEESISELLLPARHPDTRRHSRQERKQNQQAPQTIDEFWNEEPDGWW
jgi:hypothetical protein